MRYTILEPMKRRRRSKPTENARTARTFSGWPILLAAGAIVLATMIAYGNSYRCPFVFDDKTDIVDNTSIRHLWPIWNVFVLRNDGRSAFHNRPVVNFSLALNHAVGGLEPFAYHVTNLLIHVLAGLTLFGIVRRTLLLPSLSGRFAAAATSLALAVALIWVLHPLQTQAVTYVIQRYESMMGLFYLLTLYATIRCGTSAQPGRWTVAAVAAAFLALGCKEVAISIPITILLYDRAFLAGSFREAWRRRPWLYVGLVAAWAPFIVLQLSSSGRGNWAGYSLPITWIEYARSQFGVILHYLRLTFWPCPLALDYGWPVARTVGQIVPAAAVIGGLAAATGYALIRQPKWGFLGAWFFLILAPTSSILPILDLAFEHRMYLPLAAVVAGVVTGGYVVGQRLVAGRRISRSALQAAGYSLLPLVAVVIAIVTSRRNEDYRSEISIWTDAVAKRPENARAHSNLGLALMGCGRLDEAFVHFRRAVDIKPDNPDAHDDLGLALAECNRLDEAFVEYREALRLKPEFAEAHNNYAISLANCRRIDEAIVHFREVLRIRPDFAETDYNLGAVLAGRGQIDEAIDLFRKALDINPDLTEVRESLDRTVAKKAQLDEAVVHYRKAAETNPERAEAHNDLAMVQAGRGHFDEAIAAYQAALKVNPNYAEAHTGLGIVLSRCGRFDEAIVHFQKALEIKPDYAEARENLDSALHAKERAD